MKAFVFIKGSDVNLATQTLITEIRNARIRTPGIHLQSPIPISSSLQFSFMFRVAKLNSYLVSMISWNAKESVLNQIAALSCVEKLIKLTDTEFDELKAATDEYTKIETTNAQKLQQMRLQISNQVKEMFV